MVGGGRKRDSVQEEERKKIPFSDFISENCELKISWKPFAVKSVNKTLKNARWEGEHLPCQNQKLLLFQIIMKLHDFIMKGGVLFNLFIRLSGFMLHRRN